MREKPSHLVGRGKESVSIPFSEMACVPSATEFYQEAFLQIYHPVYRGGGSLLAWLLTNHTLLEDRGLGIQVTVKCNLRPFLLFSKVMQC